MKPHFKMKGDSESNYNTRDGEIAGSLSGVRGWYGLGAKSVSYEQFISDAHRN